MSPTNGSRLGTFGEASGRLVFFRPGASGFGSPTWAGYRTNLVQLGPFTPAAPTPEQMDDLKRTPGRALRVTKGSLSLVRNDSPGQRVAFIADPGVGPHAADGWEWDADTGLLTHEVTDPAEFANLWWLSASAVGLLFASAWLTYRLRQWSESKHA